MLKVSEHQLKSTVSLFLYDINGFCAYLEYQGIVGS
jgi:hypothetical protein